MKFHHHWMVTAFFVVWWGASSVANAALVPALGGQVVNDTDLHVTWLANADLAATNTFGVTGIAADGSMSWSTAQSWIDAMNAANYLGYNNWRLPNTSPVNGSAFNYNESYNGITDLGYNVSAPGTAYAGSTGSEMAHLFYDELGNKSVCNPATSTATSCVAQPGWGLTNAGPFTNLHSSAYWSDTGYAPNTLNAWYFYFIDGDQYNDVKSNSYYALAVRPEPIAAVPISAAAWLFGSGLLGLIGIARRNAV